MSVGACGLLVRGPPWIQKTVNAQVPYVKWCRRVHTIGSPQIPGPETGNAVFHLKLVKSKDAKPPYNEGQTVLLRRYFPKHPFIDNTTTKIIDN